VADFDPTRLPAAKRDGIVRSFGDEGRAWLEEFPALIEACEMRWQLTLQGAASAGYFTNMTYFAEGPNGERLVLKLGYPHIEQITEMIALRCYAGKGAPRLVDCDEALRATLMERVDPGTTFRDFDHSLSRSRLPMNIFTTLPVRTSHVDGLPTFDNWLVRAFADYREKFDEDHSFYRHVVAAERIWAALRARHPEDWLLHGDLHHENILRDDTEGWLAIDPKGVIGPRPMECGRFLHNFCEDEIEGVDEFADATVSSLCEVMDVRLHTFEETLGISRRDLAAANYVDAVLSFCWTVNDRPGYADFQPVDAALTLVTDD